MNEKFGFGKISMLVERMPVSHYAEFKTADLKRIHEFVRSYPFAHICKNNAAADIPDIVSVPVIQSPDRRNIEFHMARSNSAFRNFANGGKAVIAVTGPNAHVSPSWYLDKLKSGDRSGTAPTWNYIEARFEIDMIPMRSEELTDHLERLVSRFEKLAGWSFSEIDPGILRRWSGMIAGFSARVHNAEAIFKLSQDQSAADRLNIVEGLRRRNNGFDHALAEAMELKSS
jgi:transcriptional regulator